MIQETIQAKWTTDTQSKIYHDSINIRYNVFIVEQKFPEGSDIDALEEESEHLVLYNQKQEPLATARIIELEDHWYRIERVAVSKNARKLGLGKILIQQIEERVLKNGGKAITLNSESEAIGFYEKHGYNKIGPEYLDYHIMHQKMIKIFNPSINRRECND